MSQHHESNHAPASLSRGATISHNSTRLFSTADTWGSAQIVAAPDRVLLDIETRNYNTAGHLCRDHALANLSLQTARRLRDLLSEAIAVATETALDTRQSALWSPATTAAVASRFGGVRS